MPLDVTSWFMEQTLEKVHTPLRKFLIETASANADLTDRVLRWPTIRHAWNTLRPNNINLRLANTDGELNFLHNDTLMMRRNGWIQLGYTHPTSGDEYIDLFKGEVTRVSLKHGEVQVYFTDKWDELTRKIVGTDENPVDYTNSEHLASDLVWYLCTSHGGLDATTSTANPDIDWDSFYTFEQNMTTDNVLMKGYLTDVKASEALNRISHQLDTAIFVDEDNKLTFKRFTVAETEVTTLTGEQVVKCNIDIDETEMINRQYIYGDFNVDSDVFDILVFEADTPSINSYGLSEAYEKDNLIWHVNSSTALNRVQRTLLLYKTPFQEVTIDTALQPIVRTIGETIKINNPLFEVEGGYRLLKKRVDLHTGKMQVSGDKTTFLNVFTLDYSALDSTYVLL